MDGCYRLADRIIRIRSIYPEVQEMCAAYRAEGTPDFSVECRQEHIDAEREHAAREDALEGRKPRDWSEAYLETLAVYRQIAEKLPDYDTVLFHGSALAADGTAYLFTARSGTGKSTHARLWREALGDRVVMINDDKPLLRIAETGAAVYGTPWDGKHHLSGNLSAPLKAVCILERSPVNRIARISPREAYAFLLQQCYRPADAGAMGKTLALLDRLTRVTELFRLGCNMDPEAALTACEGMGVSGVRSRSPS